MGPSTAREALIIEAIGEVARLIRQVEDLAPDMQETCQALHRADAHLHKHLAGFEARMAAISEHAKTQTVQHLETRMNATAQQFAARLCGALADAAQQAFQDQVGATVKRQQYVLQELEALLRGLKQQRAERWVPWATHTATALLTALLTSLLPFLGPWR